MNISASLLLALLVAAAVVSSTLAQPQPITSLGSFAGRGFDIVYERLKPRLINHRYNTNSVMRFNGVDYLVPDELYDTVTPRTLLDSRARVFQTYQEHFEITIRSTSLSLSLSLGGVKLGAAFSRTKGTIEELLKNGTRAFSSANNVVDFFQLGVFPVMDDAALDERFKAAVAALPVSFDPESYGRFLMGWGTHFVNSAQYGGKVNFTVSFDHSLIYQRSFSWVEQQASFSIGFSELALNFTSSLTKNVSHIDMTFSQSANSTKEITGGDGAVLEAKGFAPWVETVQQRPALILEQSELLPISTMIFDRTKAANMEKAIIMYCNNAGFRNKVEHWSRFDNIKLYPDEL